MKITWICDKKYINLNSHEKCPCFGMKLQFLKYALIKHHTQRMKRNCACTINPNPQILSTEMYCVTCEQRYMQV